MRKHCDEKIRGLKLLDDETFVGYMSSDQLSPEIQRQLGLDPEDQYTIGIEIYGSFVVDARYRDDIQIDSITDVTASHGRTTVTLEDDVDFDGYDLQDWLQEAISYSGTDYYQERLIAQADRYERE